MTENTEALEYIRRAKPFRAIRWDSTNTSIEAICDALGLSFLERTGRSTHLEIRGTRHIMAVVADSDGDRALCIRRVDLPPTVVPDGAWVFSDRFGFPKMKSDKEFRARFVGLDASPGFVDVDSASPSHAISPKVS